MMLTTTQSGTGPTLVLLHGYPLDQGMWHEQRSTLSTQYRVITPDLPGHGQTPLGDRPLTVDAMADDVIALLDAQGITEPVVVGGLSMGGYVALSLAVRYRSRLRGLILMNTRAGADAPETARIREELALIVEREESADAVVRTLYSRLFAPAAYKVQADLVEATRVIMAASSPAGVAATSRALAVRPDRTNDLASIHIPTLVIAGADDQLIPLSEAELMASTIPGAELVIIPNSGHLSPLENPVATNAAIGEFLGRIR